jgi:hypothetical protein
MGYPIPAFKITLDGQDITGKFAPRLVSLDLTECRTHEFLLQKATYENTFVHASAKRGGEITVQSLLRGINRNNERRNLYRQRACAQEARKCN